MLDDVKAIKKSIKKSYDLNVNILDEMLESGQFSSRNEAFVVLRPVC